MLYQGEIVGPKGVSVSFTKAAEISCNRHCTNLYKLLDMSHMITHFVVIFI